MKIIIIQTVAQQNNMSEKKKKQIQKTKILYMYNVTKMNLFADAPVRQSGNSVNAHELLIMALFNFAL